MFAQTLPASPGYLARRTELHSRIVAPPSVAASHGGGHWLALSWVEWFGVVGVLATLLGLFLTWKQSVRAAERATQAKTAAEAAQSAMAETQTRLQANQLFVLIPQLRFIANEIDIAIDSDDSSGARRSLDNWRWQAAHIRGVLGAAPLSEKRLLKALQDSVALAFSANGELLDGKRPVLDACRQARDSIGGVCHDLAAWVAENSMNATPGSE